MPWCLGIRQNNQSAYICVGRCNYNIVDSICSFNGGYLFFKKRKLVMSSDHVFVLVSYLIPTQPDKLLHIFDCIGTCSPTP